MVGKGKNFAVQIAASNLSQTSKKPKITIEQIRAKRNIQTNQALVNADAAEHVVLSLLDICADTTEQFESLAQGDDKVALSAANKENDEDIMTNGADITTANTSTSSNNSSSSSSSNRNSNSNGAGNEDRTARIMKNGQLIHAKLKRIHELLAPHAHLVVNYSNEQTSQSAPTQDKVLVREDDGSKDGGAGEVKSEVQDAGEVQCDQKGDQKGEGDGETKEPEDEMEEDQNMYSSRMEMRLAIERRNLLRDLLKLEKQRRKHHSDGNTTSADFDCSDGAKTQKRKREE
eukprot:scaffold588_cov282-Chaetoceros_neogracile.AAC.14